MVWARTFFVILGLVLNVHKSLQKQSILQIWLIFFQREHLKVAQQYFQLVGGSASECGKFIPVQRWLSLTLNLQN